MRKAECVASLGLNPDNIVFSWEDLHARLDAIQVRLIVWDEGSSRPEMVLEKEEN